MNFINLLFPDFKKKAFTLSFDDGADGDIALGELLSELGMKCTFNLCSGNFVSEDRERRPGELSRPLKVSEAKKLFENPNFEVASHGWHHPFLSQIPTSDALHDVVTDRRTLEKTLGRFVRGFAYPFGDRDETVREILRLAGFVYARSVGRSKDFYIPASDGWYDWIPSAHYFDSDYDRLAPIFKKETPSDERPWLFYVWGHSCEYREKKNGIDAVRERFEPLAHLDDVWYATNIEIHDYVEAYRKLIFFADSTHVYNPTLIPVFFNCNHGKFKVAPGETVKIYDLSDYD